mgnify:FL=1|jgi:hypothetical protein
MDDLLKEAIADAKAVRETALENAKIALEEAFTPRLQSMLSKKIQSEIEAEGAHEDDEDVDERMHDEDEDDMDEKMRLKADDEDPTDKDSNEAMHDEEEDDVEERMHGEEEDDVEERMHDEEEDDDPAEGRMKDEDEDDMDEDLDLEAVLKELETEAMHDEDEDDVEEGMHDEEEDEDKMDENDVSSGIGSADNKLDKKAGDSTEIGKADSAKFKESVDEEELNLDEVLKALTEDDEVEEEVNEVAKLQSELQEHRDVVKYLRGKLNEVNLLNAKLLFTNKLFRAYGLSNDQKMKVVETFDRATNLREVKLVYSTLAESFGTKTKTEIKESKGSASKAVASTKSEKQGEILSEGAELRDRFKKLAGIKI